jgi:hypothetical protein
VPRSFLHSEAVVIAVAACLVEAKFSRGHIRGILSRLGRTRWASLPKPNPLGFGDHSALVEAAESRGRALLEVGDGQNVRLTLDPEVPGTRKGEMSTGWLQVTTGARLADDYEPAVVTTINLGRIRDGLR